MSLLRISTMMLSVLAVSSCERPVRAPLPADTLVRISEDEPKSLDPQTASDLATVRIASEQFEGLTRFDGSGKPEPAMAQSWTVSASGLEWRFQLREGLRFSDGKPINADLFPRIFARLSNPMVASPHGALFSVIAAVRAEGARMVVVTLRFPAPHLAELLAHPAMAALPLHHENWVSTRPMVSSGAYRLTGWLLGNAITLEANPSWYDGRPPIARIRWRPVSDTLVALRLFQGGEADTVGEVPSSRLDEIRRDMPGTLRVAPYNGTYYFAFNTRKPPFDDVRVRQALSMSVDRELLSGRLMATGVLPAWGVVPPGVGGQGSFQPAWAKTPHRVRINQARALLQAAGYGAGNPLRFEIRFNSDTDHRRTAVALAAMWRSVGVEAQLLNSEASLHFASLRRGDFALARSGWIGDVGAPENYLAVHTRANGPGNYAGFADEQYEALLNKALHEPVSTRRAAAMHAAEVRLSDQAPILPLWYYVSKSLVAERVQGWQDNAAHQHPSRNLSLR
jgi:oligopeptide transport system substrate-binding protein